MVKNLQLGNFVRNKKGKKSRKTNQWKIDVKLNMVKRLKLKITHLKKKEAYGLRPMLGMQK